MKKAVQKILFGSPGTGKSHKIKNAVALELSVDVSSKNYIPTVFHPEYTYGDFMGKLMPLTDDSGKVSYKFYAGHFLKALGLAYKNLINSAIQYDKDKREVLSKYKEEIKIKRQDEFSSEQEKELEQRYALVQRNTQNVLLVIDEINRGNSAAIFGTVFQLLDRRSDNWSEYPVLLSDLESLTLLKEIGLIKELKSGSTDYFYKETPTSKKKTLEEKEWKEYLDYIISDLSGNERFELNDNYVKIPSNLSIIATMNTSDNSIYFMDSAFKRRWDWEFIEIEDIEQKELLKNTTITLNNGTKYQWCSFVDRLNGFIKSNYDKIRKIEDKQVGYRFINEYEITEDKLKNKLLFFIWDNVFGTNKDPLIKLLFDDINPENKRKLVTFGDFAKNAELFVSKIMTNSF
jgi:5-methylcytosine-specific restriction endonuclease McrBC GTP-binding regulatory subunit McrB